MGNCIRATLAVVALILTSIPAQAAVSYRITDLGDLPLGSLPFAYGINDVGQAVGYSEILGSGIRAFRWTTATGMEDLGSLGGHANIAFGINNSGQVVGYSAGYSGTRPFRWTQRGGMQSLDTFLPSETSSGSGEAFGVNTSGQVVGWSYVKDVVGNSVPRAALWKPDGGIQDLGELPGGLNQGLALSINNVGQVVGYSYASTGRRAFLWSTGAGMQDLGDLAGGEDESSAQAINDRGQVVGWSIDDTPVPDGFDPLHRAFLWTADSGMQNLGVLPEGGAGRPAAAYGINEAGQVVGESGDSAVLWTVGDGVQDLNALIDPLDPLKSVTTLTSARDINNVGQIVGGAIINGIARAFLLTPVPEPASWALLLAGLGLTWLTLRRRASVRNRTVTATRIGDR